MKECLNAPIDAATNLKFKPTNRAEDFEECFGYVGGNAFEDRIRVVGEAPCTRNREAFSKGTGKN